MKMMTLIAISTMTACAAAVYGAEATGEPPGSREYVRIESGFIHGRSTGAIDEFLGVPYAAPPVGNLRWKAPLRPADWDGVRDATAPGSECIQLANAADGSKPVTGSEDCLYLNIYRPTHADPDEPLPVLLFIHGGSNQKGSGYIYDPSAIVQRTGIIVVTINYRLNVFGFLALPSLDTEAGDFSSGNFGLLDQQAAMRWVHRNIAAFGGNPFNVTLAGESAGAIDMCAHLVSPPAAGLFEKAIMESMYCPTTTHDEALQVGAPVATALNCTDSQSAATCMRAKAAADVIKAAEPLSVEPGGGNGFNASPNFGNRLLPLQVSDAISAGKWNRPRILVGSNHDEAALFVAPVLFKAGVPLPLSDQAYRLLVARTFGTLAPKVMKEYPLDQYRDTFIAYADELTDSSPLGCDTSRWSDLFSLATETYRYEFNDQNAPIPALLDDSSGFTIGAYHGSELQYLFEMSQLPGPQTVEQHRLSNEMIRYWTNFAKNGNPNGPGLVRWPRYEPNSKQILSLTPGGNTVINNFDDDHRCAFWAEHQELRSYGF